MIHAEKIGREIAASLTAHIAKVGVEEFLRSAKVGRARVVDPFVPWFRSTVAPICAACPCFNGLCHRVIEIRQGAGCGCGDVLRWAQEGNACPEGKWMAFDLKSQTQEVQ